MKQKSKKILIVSLILLTVGATAYWLFKPETKPLVKPIGQAEKPITPQPNFILTDWEDPAGFAFSYPQELSIDPHEEDEINYAHLELTSDQHPGGILIIVNDSSYSSVDEWLSNDIAVKDGNALDTQVAEIGAKRVALPDGQEITAMIDVDQVIYLIQKEAAAETEFWSQVYKEILDSFELIPLEDETEEEFNNWLKGFDTSQADVVEPMEIIE